MSVRHGVERKIVREVVLCLLRAGYSVTYNDGEEDVHTEVPSPSTAKTPMVHFGLTNAVERLLAAMQCEIKGRQEWAVDDCRLFVCDQKGMDIGWVRLTYGNDDGTTVVSDYTTNLEQVLKPADELAKRIEEGEF